MSILEYLIIMRCSKVSLSSGSVGLIAGSVVTFIELKTFGEWAVNANGFQTGLPRFKQQMPVFKAFRLY